MKLLIRHGGEIIGANTTDGYEIIFGDYNNTEDTDNTDDYNTDDYNTDVYIGTYVKYNVSYTDMYSGYEFTENDGWRVLDPGTKNPDGSYSGTKLISTGIPAKLYYHYSDVSSAPWAGTASQISDYTQEFYASSSATNSNMKAAVGLYYNFEKIQFNPGTTTSIHNKGCYTEINEKTNGTLSGEEFIVDDGKEVHNLTMYELNEARNKKAGEETYALNQGGTNSTSQITTANDAATGLFYLRGLNKFNYTSSSKPDYWLASPYSGNTYYVWTVAYNGNVSINISDKYGVRPVVSLKPNVHLEIVSD